MQSVIRWTDEVVNGLYPLQWQVIGYAPFPDGTIDYNHPYHSMPNPNPCISRVLSMYSLGSSLLPSIYALLILCLLFQVLTHNFTKLIQDKANLNLRVRKPELWDHLM